jgi:hypothetical protein
MTAPSKLLVMSGPIAAATMAVLEHVAPPETSGALFKDVDCLQIPVPTWTPDWGSIATRSGSIATRWADLADADRRGAPDDRLRLGNRGPDRAT